MEWRHKPPPESLWGTQSDVDTLRDTASLAGVSLPSAPPQPGAGYLQQFGGLVRGMLLAGGAAASASVAAAGMGILWYLLLTRAFTPPQVTFTRPLYLDYSNTDIVAQTAFLPEAQLVDGLLPSNLPPDTRFLAAGQPVDIWVDLTLTTSSLGSEGGHGGGMVQLVAVLLTADGRVAGKASQPVLLRSKSRLPLWSLLAPPLRWLGLLGDTRPVHVRVFRKYREKADAPFFVFKLAIKCRSPTWAPEVLEAAVRVQLRMNPLQRLLYALRPGYLLTLAAGLLALAWLVGGSASTVALLAALLYTASTAGEAGGKAGAHEGGPGSTEDDVSSVSGISDAGSELLRDSFDEEPPAVSASSSHPSFNDVAAATAAAADAEGSPRWASPASDKQLRGRRLGGGLGGLAHGDDTPFVGSEAGSSLGRRPSGPAGSLRRRSSGSAW